MTAAPFPTGDAPTLPPDAQVTSYLLRPPLPEGHVDAWVWCITVDYTGQGLWRVRRGHGFWGTYEALNRELMWDLEPAPDHRGATFATLWRWELQDALDAAQAALPSLNVNGHTPASRHPDLLAGWLAAYAHGQG